MQQCTYDDDDTYYQRLIEALKIPTIQTIHITGYTNTRKTKYVIKATENIKLYQYIYIDCLMYSNIDSLRNYLQKLTYTEEENMLNCIILDNVDYLLINKHDVINYILNKIKCNKYIIITNVYNIPYINSLLPYEYLHIHFPNPSQEQLEKIFINEINQRYKQNNMIKNIDTIVVKYILDVYFFRIRDYVILQNLIFLTIEKVINSCSVIKLPITPKFLQDILQSLEIQLVSCGFWHIYSDSSSTTIITDNNKINNNTITTYSDKKNCWENLQDSTRCILLAAGIASYIPSEYDFIFNKNYINTKNTCKILKKLKSKNNKFNPNIGPQICTINRLLKLLSIIQKYAINKKNNIKKISTQQQLIPKIFYLENLGLIKRYNDTNNYIFTSSFTTNSLIYCTLSFKQLFPLANSLNFEPLSLFDLG